MKCYLEIAGVLAPDNQIAMKQAISYFSTSEDIINSCRKEQTDIGIGIYKILFDYTTTIHKI